MKQAGNFRLIGLIAIVGLLVLASTNSGSSFSSVGYSSAFQGPKIEFYGAQFSGKTYTLTPSTALSFNPNTPSDYSDIATLYYPTVDAEMTSVFLPADSSTYINFPNILGIQVPNSWTQNLDLFANVAGYTGQNPTKTYDWNVSDSSTGTPYMVQMQQYEEKFYVSFSTHWTSSQDPKNWVNGVSETHYDNTYNNLMIWFKVDTTPTWYIQGGGTAFCGIAKIQMADNVQMEGRENNGHTQAARGGEVVTPESAQSLVYLYYNPYGGNQVNNPTPETYQGQYLNTAYFRNETYFYINLNNFGNYADSTNLGFSETTRGDVATFSFDVTLFVFGQYSVQDIQQDPTQYGRTTPVTTTDNLLSGIFGWLSNSTNIGILVIIGIIVLMIIFAPWLLVVIISLFAGGKRR